MNAIETNVNDIHEMVSFVDTMTFKKCEFKKDATYAVLLQIVQIIILLDHFENHISQFCNTHSMY